MANLKTPELMRLEETQTGAVTWGGDQNWYPDEWQRRAGCGPTAAASLIFYEVQKRKRNAGQPVDRDREALLALMQTLWQFITPGHGGVNQTSMFAEGLAAYRKQTQDTFEIDVLDIAEKLENRASFEMAGAFLEQALKADEPVAFLNLCSGDEPRIDAWHWVMIYAFNPQTGEIDFFDEGIRKMADLRLWHQTTKRRGGFVRLRWS